MKRNFCFKIVHLPALILLTGLPGLLTSCSSSGDLAGASGGGWVSVVIGIVLLLGFVGLVIYLWRLGKLRVWYAAGTNAARLKSQDMRIKNELRSLERERSQLVAELGERAWQARVSDPAYESAYNQLLTIQGQMDGAGDYCQTLEEKKSQLTQQHEELEQNFSGQIDELKKRHADIERSMNEAKNRVRELEADLNSAADEKARFQRDVKDTRSWIIELERSDEPANAAQLAELNQKLSSLTASLLEATDAEPELAARLPDLQNQVLGLSTELSSLQSRIQATEGDRANALSPLEDQLAALDKQIRNKNHEIRELEEQLAPMVKALGEHVDAARPLSPELTEIYQKLDMITGKVSYKTQTRGDITNNLGEVDKAAATYFFGLVLLGVIVLILALLLLTGVI